MDRSKNTSSPERSLAAVIRRVCQEAKAMRENGISERETIAKLEDKFGAFYTPHIKGMFEEMKARK